MPEDMTTENLQRLSEGQFANFGDLGFSEPEFSSTNGDGEAGFDDEAGFDAISKSGAELYGPDGNYEGDAADFSGRRLREFSLGGGRIIRNKTDLARNGRLLGGAARPSSTRPAIVPATPAIISPGMANRNALALKRNQPFRESLGQLDTIVITINNTASTSGFVAVDQIVSALTQSGGLPIFGQSRNQGQLVNPDASSPAPYALINGAPPLSTSRKPTLGCSPTDYNLLLSTTSSQPFQVVGMRVEVTATNPTLIPAQLNQSMLVIRYDISGNNQSKVFTPGTFRDGYQFNQSMVEMADVNFVVDQNTELRVSAVAGTVTTYTFFLGAQVNGRNALLG